MNGPLELKGNSSALPTGVGSEVNNEQNLVDVVRERPLIFVFVRKDERLRDRNKLLRGNDQLNVQIHSQLFPISLFLCTFFMQPWVIYVQEENPTESIFSVLRSFHNLHQL